MEIHEDLIGSCIDRLRAAYDTLRACIVGQQIHETAVLDKDYVNRSRQETARMCRLLKLLHEYVSDYDCEFQMREERTILPLARAYRYESWLLSLKCFLSSKLNLYFRGKHFTLTVRFPNQGRQPEDLEIWTHSNETLATVRRHILNRIKGGNVTSVPATTAVNPTMIQQQAGSGASQQAGLKLDLYLNNELIEPSEGSRLVAELPLRDKTVGHFNSLVVDCMKTRLFVFFDRCLRPNCRSLALPYLDHRTVVVIAAPADHRSTQRILSTE